MGEPGRKGNRGADGAVGAQGPPGDAGNSQCGLGTTTGKQMCCGEVCLIGLACLKGDERERGWWCMCVYTVHVCVHTPFARVALFVYTHTHTHTHAHTHGKCTGGRE